MLQFLKRTHPKNSGLSIVELMIAVGITAISFTMILPTINFFYTQYKNLSTSHSVQDSSMLLLRNLDCTNTINALAGQSCTTGSANTIALKNSFNAERLAAPEQDIGGVRFRAQCQYQNFVNTINLQYFSTKTNQWTDIAPVPKICPPRRLTFDYSAFTEGATYYAGFIFSGRSGSCDLVQTPICFLGKDSSGKYGRIRYEGTNHTNVRRFCASIGGRYISGTGNPVTPSSSNHYLVEWNSGGAGGWTILSGIPMGAMFHDAFQCSF